jgi:LysM repeat protein
MRSWKRLTLFLLLNIVVSACTTLTVLYAWDQLFGPTPRHLLSQFLVSQPTDSTPAPTAETTAQPGEQPAPTPEYIVYQVKAGDTFENIASRYRIGVEELIAINGFTRSQPLGAGEVLRIPVQPKGSVKIDSVVGAGDLDSEHVLLKHGGEGELSLTGWRLQDDQGNVFVFPQFPQLTLYAGGAVNIYTKPGKNTVVELYWGLDHPVWKSGATVTLLDAQGKVHDTYTIP